MKYYPDAMGSSLILIDQDENYCLAKSNYYNDFYIQCKFCIYITFDLPEKTTHLLRHLDLRCSKFETKPSKRLEKKLYFLKLLDRL